MFSTPSQPQQTHTANVPPQKLDTNQQARALPWWIGRRWFALFWLTSTPFNYHTGKTPTTGGSGGKKSGGSSTQVTAYCDVAGVLACATADFLEAIEVNGEIVWSGGISRDGSHPEHTDDIVVPNVGTFRFHWGTETGTGDFLILNSGTEDHPYYRGQPVLEAKNLACGASETVPQVRALVERAPQFSGLDGGRSREGANAVTGVAELVENSFFGLGRTGAISLSPAAALASTLQARTKVVAVPGDPSHTARMSYISAFLEETQSFGNILAGILENFDGWARRNGSQLELGQFPHTGMPIGLAELSLHDLTEDPEFPSPGKDDADVITDAVVTGPDRDIQLQDSWQTGGNDAARDRLKYRRNKSYSRPFLCTSYQQAEAAQELANFYSVPAKEVTVKFRREKVGSLQPGDRFILNYSPSSSRVVHRVTRRSDSARGGVVELGIIRERGLAPLTYIAPANAAPALPTPPAPTTNVHARIFQVPMAWVGDPTPTVIPLVARPAADTLGFRVHYSADDVSYDQVADTDDWAIRGTLVSGISSGASNVTVSISSFDLALLLEQTTAAQLDDALLAFIGGEIVSIGTVTALGGGQYQLGILRGRRGSAAASHATSDECYIQARATCQLLQHANFPRAIATRYFKLPTFTARDAEDLSTALKITFSFADGSVSAPSSVSATGGDGHISVQYTNPSAGDLQTLEIWERTAASPVPVDGDTPDFTVAVSPNGGAGLFVRAGLAANVTRYYWLRNRDTIAGKSSIIGPYSATTATSQYTAFLTNQAHTVVCDSGGTPVTGELGLGGRAYTNTLAFKFATALSPVGSSPGAGQYSASIATFAGTATWTREANDLFRCDSLSTDTAVGRVTFNIEGFVTIVADWTISKVKAGATGGTGSTGAPGGDATAYQLVPDAAAVKRSVAGVYTPATVNLLALSKTGTGGVVAYSGRFTIETWNGTSWTTQYTSSSNESSKAYSVPSSILAIRATLYLAGGTVTLLDQQIVPVVDDGATGATGGTGPTGGPGSNGATILARADGGGSTSGSSYSQLPGGTDLFVNVTLDGNPHYISLTAGYIANASGSTGTVKAAIYRGTTLVGEWAFGNGMSLTTSSPSTDLNFSVIDAPAAGTYTYHLRLANSNGGAVAGGGTLSVS